MQSALTYACGLLLSDCGQHSNSRTVSEKKIDGSSSVIPSKSKLKSLTIIDQEKERKTDIAGMHHLLG